MTRQTNIVSLRQAASHGDPAPMLRQVVLSIVGAGDADLSFRQLGVFLTLYLDRRPHTVRSLAAELDIREPAVCRVLDGLGALGFTVREPAPAHRGGALVGRTAAGWVFFDRLRRSASEGRRAAGGRARAEPVEAAWPRASPAAGAGAAAGRASAAPRRD